MRLESVSASEYKEVFGKTPHVFNSVDFSELNSVKCEQVHYLFFRSKSCKLGIVVGVREGSLLTPFSAPYGGFSYNSLQLGIEDFSEAVELLIGFAVEQGLGKVRFVLPPSIYGERPISQTSNALLNNGFSVTNIDLNHYVHLSSLEKDYDSCLTSNGRRNLRIATEAGLSFRHIDSAESYEEAYQVVQENRAERGFPLHLSFEALTKTIDIVPTDVFGVFRESKLAASAFVFHVADKSVQVIYWGDRSEFRDQRPMNFLAQGIAHHYAERDFELLDLGPSTERSVPNVGLCEFKESIGARVCSKLTMERAVGES